MGWARSFGNARTFVATCMGGVRGGSNLAAWALAGTLAYVLWIKPERQARREQEAKAALAANTQRYTEKSRPIRDPQNSGYLRRFGLPKL